MKQQESPRTSRVSWLFLGFLLVANLLIVLVITLITPREASAHTSGVILTGAGFLTSIAGGVADLVRIQVSDRAGARTQPKAAGPDRSAEPVEQPAARAAAEGPDGGFSAQSC